jgi:predicted NBD/HSP70 family sugar kinase
MTNSRVKRKRRTRNERTRQPAPHKPVVLVIDVGGSNIKLRKSDSPLRVKFKSGPKMTPDRMVAQALLMTAKWDYEVVSIGFAGPVVHGKPACDPENLGRGWTDFDFRKAFKKPVKLINDAAMQALGCYHGGRMLFLGLGTGVGSTLILDEVVVPLELGELRYSRNQLLKDMLGKRGLKKIGDIKWEQAVHAAVANLKAAFVADYIVLGGGNVKKLRKLPEGTRRGSNRYAFHGGIRLWHKTPITAEVRQHTLVIA